MRLSTKDFLFYQMLYKLWLLLVYYADIFCYSAPKNMLEMDMETDRYNGLSFIRIRCPNIKQLLTKVNNNYDEAEIMQKYLDYFLLLDSDLKPYRNGDGLYDTMNCLYIDYSGIDPTNPEYHLLKVLYVCDSISYNYARSKQGTKTI